jgi:Ca2+-binding RTX toxin-like protein
MTGERHEDTIYLQPESLVGHTRILGDNDGLAGGDDTIVLDHLPSIDSTHDRPNHLLADGSDGAVDDTIDLDGGGGNDHYIVNIAGSQTAYIVNVQDSGAPNDGADRLSIHTLEAVGTDEFDWDHPQRDGIDANTNDVFLLRKNFVAYLTETGQDAEGRTTFANAVERINYDQTINGRLLVSAGNGDDQFFVDDNSAITTLDGGLGADQFQIGQVFGSNPNGFYFDGSGDKRYVDVSEIDLGLPTGEIGTDSNGAWEEYTVDGVDTKIYDRSVATDVQNINLTSDRDDIELLQITRGFLSKGITHAVTAFGGENQDTFIVYSNKAVLRMEGESGNDTFVIRAFIAEDDIIAEGGGDDDHFEYNINAPVSINGGLGFDTVVVIGTEREDAFIISKDGVFGAGLTVTVDGVEEALEIDGLEGDDQFFILSTRDNVVTTVIGGLGSDTFNVAGDVTQEIISQNLDGLSGIINHGAEAPGSDYDKLLVDGIQVTIATEQQGKVVIDQDRETTSPGLTQVTEDALSVDGYWLNLFRTAGLDSSAVAYLTVSAASSSSYDRRLPTRSGGAGDPGPAGTAPHEAESILISIDGGTTWQQSAVLTFTNLVDFELETTPTPTVTTGKIVRTSDGMAYKYIGPASYDVMTTENFNDSSIWEITDAGWDTQQQVLVKALHDDAIEGERKVMISHSLFVESNSQADIDAFDEVAISNVEVRVLDNDIGTLLIEELDANGAIDNETRILEGVPVMGGSSAIDDTYRVRLSVAPTADVTVSLDIDPAQLAVFKDNSQITSLAFTADTATVDGNWDEWVTLTVKAVNLVDDGTGTQVEETLRENSQVSTIEHSFTSEDSVYDSADGITRFDGGSWIADGFLVGNSILVETDSSPENDGSYTITEVTDTVITLSPADVLSTRIATAFTISRDGSVLFDGIGNLLKNLEGPTPVELDVRVLDDDSASVLVTESAGDTKVVKGVSGDDYTLRLVSDPVTPVTVNLFGDGQTIITGGTADRLVINPVGDAVDVVITIGTETVDNNGMPATRDTLARTDGSSWLDDGFRIGTRFSIDGGITLFKVNDIFDDTVEDSVTGAITVLSSTLKLTLDGDLSGVGDGQHSLQRNADAVTFTDANWWQEVTVEVAADLNFIADPSQQFVRNEPGRQHLVSQLDGPLIIEGGVAEDKDRSIKAAVVLPTEFAAAPKDIEVNTDETQQADRLNVFNDSSVSDDFGIMEATELRNAVIKLGNEDLTDNIQPINLSGLGMHADPITGLSTDLTIDISEEQDGRGNITFPGGITFDDIEVTEILLGQGNDTFIINDTSTGTPEAGEYVVTIVHGGGNALLDGSTTVGGDHITINGGGGPLSPLVVYGDTSQDGSRYDSRPDTGIFTGNAVFFALHGNDVIDASNSLEQITIYGGRGNDVIHGSQADDQLAGGSGNDEIHGESGNDHIYGDSGFNLDYAVTKDQNDAAIVPRILSVHTVNESLNLTSDAVIEPDTGGVDRATAVIKAGEDTIYGDNLSASNGINDGQDIIFGDFGEIDHDPSVLRLLTNDYVTEIRSETRDQGETDTISGDAGADIILGGGAGDFIYGDNLLASNGGIDGEDIIFGDHGTIVLSVGVTGRLNFTNSAVVRLLTTDTEEATGGADTIHGNAQTDVILGGVGGDTIYGDALEEGNDDNADVILGDNGFLDFADAPDSNPITLELIQTRDVNLGGVDTIHGNDGDDIILGGKEGDFLHGNANDDLILGDFGQIKFCGTTDTSSEETYDKVFFNSIAMVIESTDTDQGGADTITGDGDEDMLIGGADGDFIDGNSADDIIFGDNVRLDRLTGYEDDTNPRIRTLTGTVIYETRTGVDIDTGVPFDTGAPLVDDTNRLMPNLTGTPVWADWDITIDVSAGFYDFGDDYIAGGADDDTIFGQLGDDTIQGDGSIGETVNAVRLADLTLFLDPSVEAVSDGDDYIEGNGGNDVIFGNLGQDDIIGGSSDQFSLISPDLRPDGSDLIFGGAGTNVDRNDIGDAMIDGDGVISDNATGHARDADTILGDNGNIFRLVEIDSTTGESIYLEFVYDQSVPDDVGGLLEDRGNLRIIPRATELLDYTPGGADITSTGTDGPLAEGDIGAGDEIHGEAGDDSIYGMALDDVLFGDGQDDDLIGGYGNDWISGGTGQDGVIGDDGRIFTSRNGLAEPLHGIDATTEEFISTPGNVQQAVINPDDELKKSVDLTPFKLAPADYSGIGGPELFDPLWADDIIYGGLGSDWLHGSSGDDAISGAEALEIYFDRPFNPGNVLRYSSDTGEFAEYDEFNPRLEIFYGAQDGIPQDVVFGDPNDPVYVLGANTPFILNFNVDEGVFHPGGETGGSQSIVYESVYDDGDDKIFGDLGNDWIVGGTGRDNMYGGWGDDLLNADDDQGFNDVNNPGLNDGPDTHPTYEDRAFGGAGRDRLIANTGGDRLIDWAGEFNSYIVPFAPFGLGTVSRALQPQISEFLYDLSASDGADFTRGGDEARNGEPDGELGLVRQQDPAWQDQTGAPDDPQPGNIPGGPRDVLRSASFDGSQGIQGTGFFADSGVFEASGGELRVAAESQGGDAVAVYHVGDQLPIYFELVASVKFDKGTGGWDGNAYMIFDYQHEYDFKFVGIDDKVNKLVMGHRDSNGWHVDTSGVVQGGVKPDKWYNMLIAVNGLNVTLVVNNKEVFQHTYAARIDEYGNVYALNWGMVGMGSNTTSRFGFCRLR